jgi:medium-chain acyl-[acyl-carrier-protein] hydrolase
MPSNNDSSNRWFESLATVRTPQIRLFCFPYGGGNAHVYRDWQQYLAPEIDVCLVHLPGRARRMGERLRTRLAPLVEELADAIGGALTDRFAFYGHSMGALIAFELARTLRRRNQVMPVQLFLSACRAPTAVRAVPSTFDLSVPEFIAKIQRLRGTPKEFFEHPELQNALLPLLRADFEITDTYDYVPEMPLACPISIYGGDRDELATLEQLAPWKRETSAGYKCKVFAGDHFFLQSHKADFLGVLREDLLRTLSAPPIHHKFVSNEV